MFMRFFKGECTSIHFFSPSSGKKPLLQSFVLADRKSTRLNSSHSQISDAVFCLKKKNLTSVAISRFPRLWGCFTCNRLKTVGLEDVFALARRISSRLRRLPMLGDDRHDSLVFTQ